ncbi:MAG: alpha/beta hydrolase [Chitinophagales bacterium]|nr:alpha/beta hydrolase [Chitinophagales bacterium]MDW8393245.1 alpha/beta hydrolase [Chitinophagales bacterium]
MKFSKAMGFLAAAVWAVLASCTSEPVVPDTPDVGGSQLKDTVFYNVSYGAHERHRYDIYLPKGRSDSTPVVLMIHGGAWKAGQKEDMNYYVNQLRSVWSDVAIVNTNYRLASNAENIHHNEIMADLDAAVAHLIANRNSYQISSRIGLFGASAGGQLALIYAYRYNPDIRCVASLFGPTIISDWSWYSSFNPWLGSSIGEILTEYVGMPWDTAAYNAVSPYWNITPTTQPTLLFHGTWDPIVPVYQSQWMYGKLIQSAVAAEYYEYPAFHSFDDTQSLDVVTRTKTFFKKYM